jgi:peptidoglycan/LPS O-acetylase OafA/YrhL
VPLIHHLFNGVRALAMMWVVFGHYYFNSVTKIFNTMNIA